MSNTNALTPRARHLAAALPALALAALIAACSGGPGVTTPPTNAPSSPPGTPAGPTPTPSSNPTPTFGEGQIEHPTGATHVVLRMEQGGGFAPIGAFATQAPTFTLYGDGGVIFQQIDNRGAPFGTLANLPWLVGHLDEEGVQSLLQFALSTGRLANARDTYENNTCADCGSTWFNLNAAGEEKVVTIHGLTEGDMPGVPDQADRAGFSQLATVLREFQNQDGLGDVTPYDAELYRVTLMEGFGEPVGAPIAWPWDDVSPDNFASGDEPGAIAILDAEHVAELVEVPNGGHIGVWVLDPDDKPVVLSVRPLLPDEQAAVEAN